MSDPDPNVSAWAGYVTTLLEQEPRKSSLAERLGKNSHWLTRLLVATATDAVDPQVKAALLARLADDPDPVVQAYARATKAIAEAGSDDQGESSTGGVDPSAGGR
jgi:hypothetical protein